MGEKLLPYLGLLEVGRHAGVRLLRGVESKYSRFSTPPLDPMLKVLGAHYVRGALPSVALSHND